MESSWQAGGAGWRFFDQYNAYLRRTTNQVRITGGSTLAAVAYGYSPTSGWLDSVTSGNYAATYSYVANSPLVSQISFKQGQVVKMTTAKAYDPVNRLTAIQSAVAGANQLPQAFGYQKEFYNRWTVASSAPGGAFFGAPKGQPYYSPGPMSAASDALGYLTQNHNSSFCHPKPRASLRSPWAGLCRPFGAFASWPLFSSSAHPISPATGRGDSRWTVRAGWRLASAMNFHSQGVFPLLPAAPW